MHPPNLAAALIFVARLHQHRREVLFTQQQAEAAIRVAREQGFAQRLTARIILHGWARAMQGEITEGVGALQESLVAFRATGTRDDLP